MTYFARFILCLAIAATTASCSPPRGAALTSQILNGADDADSEFAVVAVSKTNIAQVAKWPGRAAPGSNWLENKRGPASGLLRSGDVVNISIWDSEENSLLVPLGQKTINLNGTVISSTGTVFVPYVGEIVISGQSVDEARRTIENRIATVAPAAQVVLTASSGLQNSVDLVSGMIKPGTYPLASRNQTVMSMLAVGGGIASGMRNPIVRLIRDGKTYEVSSRKLLENGALDTVVRGGDKILVEQDNRFFTSLGATGTERLNYFEKDTITALEAVSISGGLVDSRADPKGVLILREYAPSHLRSDGSGPSKTKVVFSFDLTATDSLFAARSFPVMPGDTVLVSESPVPGLQSILSIFGQTAGVSNALTR